MATKLGINLDEVRLSSGSHESPEEGMCVMELASVLAGKPFSDTPPCVSPTIGAFLRTWNDSLDEESRQLLKPYALKVLNTAGDREKEITRGWMLFDWLARTAVPAWLRLTGKEDLVAFAEQLASAAPVVDKHSEEAIYPILESASDAVSYAARVAVSYAARVAASDAASYAASDAASYAARVAARVAASDAASYADSYADRDADSYAARVAARVAVSYAVSKGGNYNDMYDGAYKAATEKLKPVVLELQQSAFQLLERLIAA